MSFAKKGSSGDTAAGAGLDWVNKYYQSLFSSILAGAAILYACLNPLFRTGFFNDDAIYVIVARKLWRAAEEYPHLGIKPDYPLPGLPLILAPLARIVAPQWTLLEWLSVMATLLSAFFLGRWIRKWLSAAETLAVMALYAFNPVVAKFSGVVMPAPYYTLFSVASFFLLSRLLEKPSASSAMMLGFVLGWGSLVRPEGILLVISVLAALLLAHYRKDLLLVMMVPLLGWLLFVLFWFQSQRTLGSEFGKDLRALVAYWIENFVPGIAFSVNLPKVFLFDTWWALRFVPMFVANLFTVAFMLVSSVAALIGFRALWRDRSANQITLSAVGLFCVSYFLIHVFWHVALPRYFIPLFPFVLIIVIRGASKIRFFSDRHHGWVMTLTLFVLFCTYAYENGYGIYQALVVRQPMNAPPWRSIEWIKQHVGVDAKITSNIEPSIELYAGRHAVHGINATNADLYFYLLMKFDVDYVVYRQLDTVTPGVGNTVDPNIMLARKIRWFRMYPERFKTVFFDAHERTRVCQIGDDADYRKAFEKFIDAVRKFDTGRYEDAFDSVNAALAIEPKLGCAQNLLGALMLIRGDSINAERAFLKAADDLPDSPNSQLNLATLFYKQGKVERSEACLEKVLQVAKANGEEAEFMRTIKTLRTKWSRGGATLFIDSPSPETYQQI